MVQFVRTIPHNFLVRCQRYLEGFQMLTKSILALISSVALLLPSAHAAEVELFSPQGTVKQVRQLTARFSEQIVAFGDPRIVEPFSIICAKPGVGRWADGRNWIYDFNEDLPAGVKCTFELKDGLKSLAGNAITATSKFQFNTGGPAIKTVLPSGGHIDENQIFIIKSDAALDITSVQENARCEIEGITERLTVKVLSGQDRQKILSQQSKRLDGQYGYANIALQSEQQKSEGHAASAERIVVLQCQRSLPNDKKMMLIWGKGIRSLSGIATEQDQVISFHTRNRFTATFSCDRVNAESACVPVMPMQLNFSAQITRAQANKIVLKTTTGKTISASGLDKEKSEFVQWIQFAGPFPENSTFTLVLPANLKDDAGRPLSNASSFPLKVATDNLPPLAKFPARFGIVELNAEPMLPVTLRNLEAMVQARAVQLSRAGDSQESDKSLLDKTFSKLTSLFDEKKDGGIEGHMLRLTQSDQDVLDWMKRLNHAERWEYTGNNPKNPGETSIFANTRSLSAFSIPKPLGPKEFEVVGIPLKKAGFYVVELESPKLGAALLGKPKPMFIQSAALVTNLAAHFKWGRESSLVWVTTLDKALPVIGAAVAVRDCNGKLLWQGKTDKAGLANIKGELVVRNQLPNCDDWGGDLFISARVADDMTFVKSGWHEGIEPWQFNLPGGSYQGPYVAHTVFDRTLLRAGETVHMKHFYRRHSTTGFDLILDQEMPSKLVIEHQGSDQKFEVPLTWNKQGIAESTWVIPPDAKQGTYTLSLIGVKTERAGADAMNSGSFRVETFRVPTMKAQIQPPKNPLVNAKEAQVDLLVSYLSGGPASHAPVKLRSQVLAKTVSFADYSEFVFGGADIKPGVERSSPVNYESDAEGESEDEGEGSGSHALTASNRNAAQTISLTTDEAGAVRTKIGNLPRVTTPHEILAELEFQDANGEIATVSNRIPLWASKLNLGIRTDGWAASKDKLSFQVLALNLQGQPEENSMINVDIFQRIVYSHRKRLLGGFYAYENVVETKRIGDACQGKTSKLGLLICEIKPPVSGEIVLRARAVDDLGNPAVSSRTLWVAGDSEWWFTVGDNDRMDVLPEKKRYEAGEVARFQVRMPFREATALITVEREGVIDSYMQKLTGKAPVIEVPIKDNYAPNVYVSVLAIRGRVDDVKATALVDLGKPAYKLGIAAIQVGWRPHELKVDVNTNAEVYKVRDKVAVKIAVRRADGSLLPKGSEIALAAVDEGLLELMPNNSWKLLDAMMQQRGIEVSTATAQMQVVGKRHFGKKAIPAGGGGGKQPTREMFDTLLLWKGSVILDEKGEAAITVPLNDALTSFRIVAVASGGISYFGTGKTTIRTSQDVMLNSGLPPLVREGDRFKAGFNVRNATDHAVTVDIKAKVTPLVSNELPTITAKLAPGEAKEINWEIAVPFNIQFLQWQVAAIAQNGELYDQMKVKQQVVATHPVRVYQATLSQLAQPVEMTVAMPEGAVSGRGGIEIALRGKLGDGLPGVKEYMSWYPYTCMEQLTSRAIALRDESLWKSAMNRLPGYLDSDGLAKYFPSDFAKGSDVLTSYILAIAHEADWEIPEQVLVRMKKGLEGFIAGRINRDSSWPNPDLAIRKLIAIEALSRYSAAQPQMLTSLTIDPNLWPTSAVLDWLNILKRVESIPDREKRIQDAQHILRSRLNFQGSTMGFSNEKSDALWWLMISADANAVRSVLSMLDEPTWQEDIPRMVRGAMGRQYRGHWNTTTANAWGVLAMEKFSSKFENVAVTGKVVGDIDGKAKQLDWSKAPPEGGNLHFDWPDGKGKLKLQQDGDGKPWATIQSRAAMPLTEPLSSGYKIKRIVTPIEQKEKGKWSRGDVLRVTLEMEAQSDMTWVVVSDPVPAGASILGNGLGRDSKIMTQEEKKLGWVWPAFEERTFEVFRAYYEFVPKGTWLVEYTVRLNNEGEFDLPATRVEAMYAPEMFGEIPNTKIQVRP